MLKNICYGLVTLLLIFCISIANLGGENKIIFVSIASVTFGYFGWEIWSGYKTLKLLDEISKIFMPGKTDIFNEIRQGTFQDFVDKMMYGCMNHLCNVYLYKVRRVITNSNLTNDETLFFCALEHTLEVVEKMGTERINLALNLFYHFNLDLLPEYCECEKAQCCLDDGLKIQEFINLAQKTAQA